MDSAYLERHRLITIGLEGFEEGRALNVGPAIFLRRLGEAILKKDLALLATPDGKREDIGLFKIDAPPDYPKPFVLRIDGVYFDNQNVLGDSDALNTPIFDSIDRATGLVFISEFSMHLVEAFHGPIRKPYTVVHNAVDLNLFSPEGPNRREELGFAPDVCVLVAAATWRRWKRLPEIVELFRRYRAASDQPVKLLVLGADADCQVDDPDVIFAGEILADELPSWYRTGNVYLHLATLEACGNTQIEAIGCGLPVLCCNNGGIGETVRKANAGIVSQADPPFPFTKIDHYEPNEPDYDVLLADLKTLVQNREDFVARMDRSAVSMETAARDYMAFIEKIFDGTGRTKVSQTRGSFRERIRGWFPGS